MLRTRVLAAILLVSGIGGLLHAKDGDPDAPPPPPQRLASINFATGYPKPGATNGELSIVVEWANCTGINKVTADLFKNVTVNGKVTKQTLGISGKNTTFPTSQWTYSMTGLKTGDVVVEGELKALDRIGANPVVLASDNPTLNVTVP